MTDPFIGEVRLFSFTFAPRGWAPCDGARLPINQNQALFALLGTAYGGDGITYFNLPNLQGRMLIGMGSGYVMGQAGGEEQHTVTLQELPTHLHTANASATPADSNVPSSGRMLAASAGGFAYAPFNPSTAVAMAHEMIQQVGGSQPHENRMPFAVLSYCIAIVGIFPSRN